MLTTLTKERLSFTLTLSGIEAVNNGKLRVGDLFRKNMGDGSHLWIIVAIEDGIVYVEPPTLWDEMFADSTA